MDDDLQAELRTLQARAYGPGGGLTDDPAAQHRLEELESHARHRRPRPATIEAVPPRPVAPPPVPTTPADQAAHAFAVPAERPTPRSRQLRRLTGLAWAGSLAMVATLAVGATAAVTSRTAWTGSALPPGTSITHVATLRVDTERAWPEAYGASSEGGAVFEEFSDVIPIVGLMPNSGGATLCIQILPREAWEPASEDGWSWSGYGGCNAEPFPATTSVVVGPDVPTGLRERFPDGTRLQFVAGDGVVDVFSADAPVTEAAG